MLLLETTGVYQDSNMEQGSLLRGGVSLCHSLVDEKHCYEVEKALTHSSSTFRKGDIVSMINNKKTQDLSPKEFISLLTSESPILTLHQAIIVKEEGQCPESDSIHAFRKEKSTLSFQLVMVREECLEAEEKNEIKPTESSWESDDMKEKDLVMVSMTETNVAVVRGRGCDPENPCNNCGITGCNVSDVIMAPKKREVTSVCRKSVWMGDEEKVQDVIMYSLLGTIQRPLYIRPVSFSEDITIYFYRSNILEDLSRGSPVVLNFTGSTNFLKCTRVNQEVGLTVESYEKEKLKDICKDDPVTWPFVFYMKTRRDNTRLFESAQNKGWFIRTEKPQVSVWMGNPTIRTQERFCFLIYPKHN
ncbi:hypothetical protein AMEX_G25975 [Astyanax mexicanus]|uniref:Interleukin-1 beta n=1 Tax=Astyanax mexicanus TaxID=7994 RepID=A0A8T2KP31_ASTMX|nr:hypothetical protein AMEX_G25975 [Astyanax mexicanus]